MLKLPSRIRGMSLAQNHPQKPEYAVEYQKKCNSADNVRPIHASHARGYNNILSVTVADWSVSTKQSIKKLLKSTIYRFHIFLTSYISDLISLPSKGNDQRKRIKVPKVKPNGNTIPETSDNI